MPWYPLTDNRTNKRESTPSPKAITSANKQTNYKLARAVTLLLRMSMTNIQAVQRYTGTIVLGVTLDKLQCNPNLFFFVYNAFNWLLMFLLLLLSKHEIDVISVGLQSIIYS